MNKKNGLIIVTVLIMMSLGCIFFYCKNEAVHILKDYNIKTGATDVSEYIIRNGDTVFEGKFTRYNKKGIKIAEGQFIDNEPNGICSYYYDNGKIKSIHFRKNSKINLESTFYDTNGLIKKYVVYDYLGNHFFKIYFDEKGATNYDGYFQIETYQYQFAHKKQFNIKEEQHLKVGDVLKYSYIIANIPNAKQNFKIENLSVDNSIVKRVLKYVEPCQLDVEEILTKKGKNTIRSIVQYKFNDKVTPVFNDTLTFEVKVN